MRSIEAPSEMAGPFFYKLITAANCGLSAENCGLTAEDFGPTATANRRLTADWETNFGVRTKAYKLATFHWKPQFAARPNFLSRESAVRS